MALRVVEIVLPVGKFDALKGVFTSDTIHGGPWEWELSGDEKMMRVLIDAQDSGRLVDAIEHRCKDIPEFHLVLYGAHAVLPRPVEKEPAPSEDEPPSLTRLIFGKQRKGRSREELYAEAYDVSAASRIFFATVVLSTVVAAVGLAKSSPAVVVGAMVIAPLLGPIMGIGLAATLADAALFRRAMTSGFLGVLSALVLSYAMGALWPNAFTTFEVYSRTEVDLSDVLLALAAGAAGTLALTTGVHAGLVGVMVAVALLPPTVVAGAMFGAGEFEKGMHASLLLATNVTGIVLAAVVTFRVQGVRPGTWWEAKRAKRASIWSLVFLVLLLAAITAALVLADRANA